MIKLKDGRTFVVVGSKNGYKILKDSKTDKLVKMKISDFSLSEKMKVIKNRREAKKFAKKAEEKNHEFYQKIVNEVKEEYVPLVTSNLKKFFSEVAKKSKLLTKEYFSEYGITNFTKKDFSAFLEKRLTEEGLLGKNDDLGYPSERKIEWFSSYYKENENKENEIGLVFDCKVFFQTYLQTNILINECVKQEPSWYEIRSGAHVMYRPDFCEGIGKKILTAKIISNENGELVFEFEEEN